MKILVADDEKSIRTVLKKFLESLGHKVIEAEDGKETLKKLQSEKIDLAFVDIKMPSTSGLEILKEIKNTPIVIITAYGTMDYTIKAMKLGAADYLTKPFDLEEIKNLIEKLGKVESSQEEQIKEQLIIGESRKIREVFKLIGRVARTDATVLIVGESGTGKELVAKAIHNYSGRRGDFIAVNCAALPPTLLEAELFGYEKGSFTGATSSKKGYFEQAKDGTLFLDEIGELNVELQSKLLRVLQEKEIRRIGGEKPIKVNTRVIAATNKDLEEEVKRGKFREDLFYRLNVLKIEIPPLRERREDIPLLANHFIQKFSKEFRLPIKRLTKRAADWLKNYDFPGNVRELENIILRAMLTSPLDVIDIEDLMIKPSKENPNFEEAIDEFVTTIFTVEQKEPNNLYEMVIKTAEKILISKVLKFTKWNQVKASKVLGIHRNTLRAKIKELGIEIPKKKI